MNTTNTALTLLREIYDDVIQGAIPNLDDPWWAAASAALAAPAQAVPSASVEQEAMQMLWDDQQQEEKEHYRNVARGTELPLYAIHHPEDINKTKRRAVPEQPVAPANVDSAPLYLNLNDRAMWVLGWNACLDKAHAAQKAAAQAAHVDAAVQRDADRYRWLKITAKPGEPTQAQPVAWPRSAKEVREFMSANVECAEYANDDHSPSDNDRYQLTAHDFLSAVDLWADFPHHQNVSQPAAQALDAIVDLAQEAHRHWDAYRDAKVGKLLMAFSGYLPGYDKRADALHAAIAAKQGEKP